MANQLAPKCHARHVHMPVHSCAINELIDATDSMIHNVMDIDNV